MNSRAKKSKVKGTQSEGQTQTLQNRVRDVFRRGLQWKWDRETGSSSRESKDPQRNGSSAQAHQTADAPAQRNWPHFAPIAIQRFRRLFSSDDTSNVSSAQIEVIGSEDIDSVSCTTNVTSNVEQRSLSEMVRMKTQDEMKTQKGGEISKVPVQNSENPTQDKATSKSDVSQECSSQLESSNVQLKNQNQDCNAPGLSIPPSNMEASLSGSKGDSPKLDSIYEQSFREVEKAREECISSNNDCISDNQSMDCEVARNESLVVSVDGGSINTAAALDIVLKHDINSRLFCSEGSLPNVQSEEALEDIVCDESHSSSVVPSNNVAIPTETESINPVIILSAIESDKLSTQNQKKLLEPLYLNIDSSNDSGLHARKSPVTVQEWVDSIPLSSHLEEDAEHANTEVALSMNQPELQGQSDACPCPLVTVRPSSAQSGTAADQRREAFSRDVSPSLQSDTGSHGSSVDSYLEARKPDPEEVLLGLGFGGAIHNAEAEVSRIPTRFLQPSKVKGVAIDDFLRYQQDLIETFESGYSGYRGLTGGAQIPSVIVAKIMEKLREHERESSTKSSAGSSPAHHAEISKRRFSRAAHRITILTKMKSRDSMASGAQAHSVLNPDNRKFLDNQGSKSPEVLRKRMIIGHRSFTFDGEGQLIETETQAEETGASESKVPSKPPPPRPLIHKDSVLSSATSLSLTSYDSDSDTDEASGAERNVGEVSSGSNHCNLQHLPSTPVPRVTQNSILVKSENILSGGEEISYERRRRSLPSSSGLLLNNVCSSTMPVQVSEKINLSGKEPADLLPTSTPERGVSWRDLHRVNSAPSISPIGLQAAFLKLQMHKEECFLTPKSIIDENRQKINEKNVAKFENQTIEVAGTPKTYSKMGVAKTSPSNAAQQSHYQITDFVLPHDFSVPHTSPVSQSSNSVDEPSSQNFQRLFSMPKSSAMFLDKEMRRKLSLNSSIDSYIARSIANSPDLKNWSTSSVSSWESDKELSPKVYSDEALGQEQCPASSEDHLWVSKLSQPDSNNATNRRRGSLKRQQKVDDDDSSMQISSAANLKVDISNFEGDSFEMEELAVEEEVRGFRTGSAHSDSSGFQEETNNNKENSTRAALRKQLSESEPMLYTQVFPNDPVLTHSAEHLKRLSLPVIRVQDESGQTQWRASSICGRSIPYPSSIRRVQSLPAKISRLGLGRLSESISPGSISDSIGNMFSSCSDESVIHLPRKSVDVTCESNQTDLLPLPAATVECCKCNCTSKKSSTKCHSEFLSQESSETVVKISQSLKALKEAQSQVKDALQQIQNDACSSSECNKKAAIEQVALVIQHQNNLCSHLEVFHVDLLSAVNNSSAHGECNIPNSSPKMRRDGNFGDNSSSCQHSSLNCMLLCEVVEKEHRKLQDLVRLNVDELVQVRVLLERILPK